PRRRVVAPPAGQPGKVEISAMLFMNKAATDGAGPAVEVLVTAPDGEIDVPFVQLEHDIAGRVGQVETGDAAVLVSGGDDPRNVEMLAGEEVHAVDHNDGNFAAALGERILDLFLPRSAEQ